jgi:hypothetical protein
LGEFVEWIRFTDSGPRLGFSTRVPSANRLIPRYVAKTIIVIGKLRAGKLVFFRQEEDLSVVLLARNGDEDRVGRLDSRQIGEIGLLFFSPSCTRFLPAMMKGAPSS